MLQVLVFVPPSQDVGAAENKLRGAALELLCRLNVSLYLMPCKPLLLQWLAMTEN